MRDSSLGRGISQVPRPGALCLETLTLWAHGGQTVGPGQVGVLLLRTESLASGSGPSHRALQQRDRDLPSPILPCLGTEALLVPRGSGKQEAPPPPPSHSGTCSAANPDPSSWPSVAHLGHCGVVFGPRKGRERGCGAHLHFCPPPPCHLSLSPASPPEQYPNEI